ncbi:MAG TPA: pitrilysin family protein, partial [Candidatus Humimicrobiaceae bacterium]|nr:pitrilysin family protein [Candidatus Humimicrobiaceae bacterium]
MDYQLDKLSNGIRVITVEMPTLESATVTYWVGVGSRFEHESVSGLSHFLEHMVFKGSKKRPSAKEISEAIDSIGGEFNASTSKEWTNFYIKARAGVIETAFDVLSDMVLNPLLKEEEIEKEKGVILEEMAMYEDTPMAKIEDVFERAIFPGNPMGRDVIGTRKTVSSILQNDFLRYRDTYYGSNNFVVTVAGGVKRNEVVKLAEKYLGEMRVKPEKEIEKFNSTQSNPFVFLESKKNEQGHLILGFLGGERGHKDRFTEAVLDSILGGGMSSRLFIEVRERRGLAYAIRTSSEHYEETGYFSTYAGVDLKRIDDAIKVILEEHYDLASGKKPISEKELNKSKEYLKGHLALSLEDTKAVDGFFGIQELMLGRIETPGE